MSEISNSSIKIHTLSPKRRKLVRTLAHIVKLWQKTLVFENLPEVDALLNKESTGSLILFWHNRLFPVTGVFHRVPSGERRLYALMSASRDGAATAVFTESLGVVPIRGSSSRRGSASARELVKILRTGHHVALTLDGPRGPAYHAKAGAATLVQLTTSPVILVAAECEDCRTLNSWDRFIVPSPFSRVRIKLDRLTFQSRQSGRDDRKTIQNTIQERLLRLTLDSHRSE